MINQESCDPVSAINKLNIKCCSLTEVKCLKSHIKKRVLSKNGEPYDRTFYTTMISRIKQKIEVLDETMDDKYNHLEFIYEALDCIKLSFYKCSTNQNLVCEDSTLRSSLEDILMFLMQGFHSLISEDQNIIEEDRHTCSSENIYNMHSLTEETLINCLSTFVNLMAGNTIARKNMWPFFNCKLLDILTLANNHIRHMAAAVFQQFLIEEDLKQESLESKLALNCLPFILKSFIEAGENSCFALFVLEILFKCEKVVPDTFNRLDEKESLLVLDILTNIIQKDSSKESTRNPMNDSAKESMKESTGDSIDDSKNDSTEHSTKELKKDSSKESKQESASETKLTKDSTEYSAKDTSKGSNKDAKEGTWKEQTKDTTQLPASVIEYFQSYYKKELDRVFALSGNTSHLFKPAVLCRMTNFLTYVAASDRFRVSVQQDKSLLVSTIYMLRGIMDSERSTENTPQNHNQEEVNNVSLAIKDDLIRLIANLSYENSSNQDLVRENGGIVYILKCSHLDCPTYPTLRNSCVFALRNLMKGNRENQKLISHLNGLDILEESPRFLA